MLRRYEIELSFLCKVVACDRYNHPGVSQSFFENEERIKMFNFIFVGVGGLLSSAATGAISAEWSDPRADRGGCDGVASEVLPAHGDCTY